MAKRLLRLGHLLLGQNQDCHLEGEFEICCTQPEGGRKTRLEQGTHKLKKKNQQSDGGVVIDVMSFFLLK